MQTQAITQTPEQAVGALKTWAQEMIDILQQAENRALVAEAHARAAEERAATLCCDIAAQVDEVNVLRRSNAELQFELGTREAQIKTITAWLDAHQSNVWSRGLHEAHCKVVNERAALAQEVK